MESIRIKPWIPLTGRLLQAGACILVLTLIGGCMGSYGNYNRDPEVFILATEIQVAYHRTANGHLIPNI